MNQFAMIQENEIIEEELCSTALVFLILIKIVKRSSINDILLYNTKYVPYKDDDIKEDFYTIILTPIIRKILKYFRQQYTPFKNINYIDNDTITSLSSIKIVEILESFLQYPYNITNCNKVTKLQIIIILRHIYICIKSQYPTPYPSLPFIWYNYKDIMLQNNNKIVKPHKEQIDMISSNNELKILHNTDELQPNINKNTLPPPFDKYPIYKPTILPLEPNQDITYIPQLDLSDPPTPPCIIPFPYITTEILPCTPILNEDDAIPLSNNGISIFYLTNDVSFQYCILLQPILLTRNITTNNKQNLIPKENTPCTLELSLCTYNITDIYINPQKPFCLCLSYTSNNKNLVFSSLVLQPYIINIETTTIGWYSWKIILTTKDSIVCKKYFNNLYTKLIILKKYWYNNIVKVLLRDINLLNLKYYQNKGEKNTVTINESVDCVKSYIEDTSKISSKKVV